MLADINKRLPFSPRWSAALRIIVANLLRSAWTQTIRVGVAGFLWLDIYVNFLRGLVAISSSLQLMQLGKSAPTRCRTFDIEATPPSHVSWYPSLKQPMAPLKIFSKAACLHLSRLKGYSLAIEKSLR